MLDLPLVIHDLLTDRTEQRVLLNDIEVLDSFTIISSLRNPLEVCEENSR